TGGIEASLRWKLTDRWTLSPGYSFLQMHLHTDPTSLDTMNLADDRGSNPEHQAQLRSHLELPRGLSWDSSFYFVGALPEQDVASYTRVDSQLSWKFSEGVEWDLVGQDLLSDHHVEFNSALTLVNPSEVKRSAYTKVTWRF